MIKIFEMATVRVRLRPAAPSRRQFAAMPCFSFPIGWNQSSYYWWYFSYHTSDRRRILSFPVIYADLGLAISLKMAPARVEDINKTSHTATNLCALQWINTRGLPNATYNCMGGLDFQNLCTPIFSLKIRLYAAYFSLSPTPTSRFPWYSFHIHLV